MIIYEISSAEGYEFVNSSNQETRSVFRGFSGKTQRENWRPVLVLLERSDLGQKLKHGDFHTIGAAPLIMRKRAVAALSEIWNANGEILPLKEESGEELFVFNSQSVDALDESQSDIVSFPSSGRIMVIQKHVFTKEKLEGIDVFHLPNSPHITYVSQRFVDMVKENDLSGINFERVWQSSTD